MKTDIYSTVMTHGHSSSSNNKTTENTDKLLSKEQDKSLKHEIMLSLCIPPGCEFINPISHLVAFLVIRSTVPELQVTYFA